MSSTGIMPVARDARPGRAVRLTGETPVPRVCDVFSLNSQPDLLGFRLEREFKGRPGGVLCGFYAPRLRFGYLSD
jgi:hypothetical protein